MRIAAVRAATLALVVATLLLSGIVHCHDLAMEDWRGALARVAATPGGGLVVEHASMEAITQRACRFQFDRESCPFPVITLHSELLSDSWSNGMAAQTTVREAEARKQLSAITSVFAMRSSFYDPMNRLHHAAAKPRVTWNDGFFEGPFPGASFAHPAQ